MRMCLIGCGAIVNKYHGPSYIKYQKQYGDLELSGCCDINAEAAKTCADMFGFNRSFTNYRDMLAECKPDAVCVNVGPSATAAIVNNVMELGYPVQMEKPPGSSLAEALSIAETARKTGVFNHVAFNRRYMPMVSEYMRYANIFGNEPIQSIFCDFYRSGRNDANFSTTAIHGIDLVRHIAGNDYKEVRFSYQEMPQYGEGVCNSFMDGETESGTHVQLRFCPMAGNNFERITINYNGSTIFLHVPMTFSYDSPGNLLHINNTGAMYNLSGAELPDSTEIHVYSGFYGEIESFFNDIKAGIRPSNNIETALQSVALMELMGQRAKAYTNSK